MNNLTSVLKACFYNEVSPEWLSASKIITTERQNVEAFIESGGEAYGFTTRVGHLDHFDAPNESFNSFMADHLYGRTYTLNAPTAKLISAVKIAQLSRGGSGVSGAAYDSLFSHVTDQSAEPFAGAWHASYGAGDVVPASWWLKNVSENYPFEPSSGDFIALVNGHFISTAFGIAATLGALKPLATYLCVLKSLSEMPGSVLSEYHKKQLPVSLRDNTPFIKIVTQAVSKVGEAIEHRLSEASANPLFESSKPSSQNSFLDFSLGFELESLRRAVLLASQHTQRVIELLTNAVSNSRLVQAPKVAASIADSVAVIDAPKQFFYPHSQGVEDARDFTLLSAESLAKTASGLNEVLEIFATDFTEIISLNLAQVAQELGGLSILIGIQDTALTAHFDELV